MIVVPLVLQFLQYHAKVIIERVCYWSCGIAWVDEVDDGATGELSIDGMALIG